MTTDKFLLNLIEVAGLVLALYVIPAAIQYFKNRTESDTLTRCLDELEHVTKRAVLTTTQTYVQALKDQDKFTHDAQKEAFDRTKTALLSMLSEEAYDVLTRKIGDFDTYVENLIESNVYEEKRISAIAANNGAI